MVTNVSDASADVKGVAATASRIATALEEDIPAAVEDVRHLVAKLTFFVDKSAPKVDTFLDDLNRTGKNLVKLSEQFGGIGPEAKEIVAERGLEQISDTASLSDTVDEVLARLPDEVERYRGGDKKLTGFFMGQVMRATRGKANPQMATKLLREKIRG